MNNREHERMTAYKRACDTAAVFICGLSADGREFTGSNRAWYLRLRRHVDRAHRVAKKQRSKQRWGERFSVPENGAIGQRVVVERPDPVDQRTKVCTSCGCEIDVWETTCSECPEGTIADPDVVVKPCEECGGAGSVRAATNDSKTLDEAVECKTCGGRGEVEPPCVDERA